MSSRLNDLPTPTTAPHEPSLVPAVARALALLDWVARERAPVGLARMATELAMPKSSVHRLCGTLVNFDYLQRQPDGSYRIGPRVMGLAQAFLAGTSVAHEFETLWREGRLPDDTVILSVLNGAEVVYVAARNGTRPLGLAFTVGMRLPAHLTATGKAMLAHLDTGYVRTLFPAEPLRVLGPRGARSVAELLDDLARTRERGYSLDDEGVRQGVIGLAAAVFDATGLPVAGVGVCVHKADLADLAALDRAGYRQMVLDAAHTLSQRLGGRVPPVSGVVA